MLQQFQVEDMALQEAQARKEKEEKVVRDFFEQFGIIRAGERITKNYLVSFLKCNLQDQSNLASKNRGDLLYLSEVLIHGNRELGAEIVIPEK